MQPLSAAELASTLALVGVVIVIAALLSGLIERSGIPQVAIFIALGAALGPAGLGLLHVTLASPVLIVVTTLSLALILFTDALGLNLREAREHRGLAFRMLGPGTLLSAALFALAAWVLLDVSPPSAAILGAALASTDPVLLKGLLRRPDLESSVRHGLRLESGLNDVVLLPIVLVAMLVMGDESVTPEAWARMGLDLFLLGPGAGIAVGLAGLATLDLVRRRVGVRRDYESLYSLGIAFAAFAAAEAVHGSGFLAAFAAGLTIASFDVELCDCFKEYGETTAELLLLLTFVLLGSSLIWSGLLILSGETLLFTVLVLLGRPLVYYVALAGSHVDRKSRALIAWFGPRGLSTLLLVLLPVFAGAPGSEELFQVASLVVLLSVALHGGALVFMGGQARPASVVSEPALAPVLALVREGGEAVAAPAASLATLTPSTPAPVSNTDSLPELIRIEEVRALRDVGAPVVVADVRSLDAWNESSVQAAGSVRLNPERPVDTARALELPFHAWVVLYCTCPNEETSSRAARDLQRRGWARARALVGGMTAWQTAGLPMEPHAPAAASR